MYNSFQSKILELKITLHQGIVLEETWRCYALKNINVTRINVANQMVYSMWLGQMRICSGRGLKDLRLPTRVKTCEEKKIFCALLPNWWIAKVLVAEIQFTFGYFYG